MCHWAPFSQMLLALSYAVWVFNYIQVFSVNFAKKKTPDTLLHKLSQPEYLFILYLGAVPNLILAFQEITCLLNTAVVSWYAVHLKLDKQHCCVAGKWSHHCILGQGCSDITHWYSSAVAWDIRPALGQAELNGPRSLGLQGSCPTWNASTGLRGWPAGYSFLPQLGILATQLCSLWFGAILQGRLRTGMRLLCPFCFSHLHFCQEIVLHKSSSESWGFSIVGGFEENKGSQPFFIKTIVPGTPAFWDRRLRYESIGSIYFISMGGVFFGRGCRIQIEAGFISSRLWKQMYFFRGTNWTNAEVWGN